MNDQTNQKATTMKKNNKLIILSLAFLCLCALTFVLTGCEGEEELGVTYYTPAWMPDGRIVANADYWYTRKPDLYHQTYWTTGRVNWVVVMDADGSNEQKLFKADTTTPICPDPTGTKLAIGYQIWNLSGNLIAEVPSLNDRYFKPDDWSPDGSKVIGTFEEGKIYVYDLKAKSIQLVAEGMAEDASWRYSPDGKTIVYSKRDSYDKKTKQSHFSIYDFENGVTGSMQIDGKKPTYIPNKNQILVWSSDFVDTGNFEKDLAKSKRYISIYDLTTLKLVRQFPKPDNVLSWYISPDGHKLIYGVNNDIGIYIMDLETGKVTELKKTSSYRMLEKK